MRILMLGQFFDPEPTVKGLGFVQALVRRGHQVDVLTGFPNYPGGKVYPGYRIRPWHRESMDGVTVNRVALYPSHDKSRLGRVANYTSFALTAALLGPFLVRKPDVVYVYHPPATIALPAFVLRALRCCPFVYDVQDLWPDTVAASGMMHNRLVLGILGRLCRLVYKRADRIVVQSPGFGGVLTERGVSAERIHVIYNWADERSIRPIPRDEELARRLGLAGRFNLLFAGTMGLGQALDAVLDAAQICAQTAPLVQFVFVGGGVDRDRLEERARDMGLSNTKFLPRQPMEAMSSILALADAVLVHLKLDPLFRITIPSKTQAYMAAGRPLLMAVAGDAAELVQRSGAGVTCPPQDPAALAAAVKDLSERGREELELMGARGRAFYERELSLRVGVERFEEVFRDAAENAGRRKAS